MKFFGFHEGQGQLFHHSFEVNLVRNDLNLILSHVNFDVNRERPINLVARNLSQINSYCFFFGFQSFEIAFEVKKSF